MLNKENIERLFKNYIEGFPGDYLDTGEYRSWCYLPKEWAILEAIINRSVEYANLDFKGYGARVNWH